MYSSAFPDGNGAGQTQHRKYSFVLDLPCTCTEHGLDGGWYSQRAPITLCEGQTPSVQGCCHTWCSLATGRGTADLSRVRSVWVSHRPPSGSCTGKETATWNRDLQHGHNQRGEIWPRTGEQMESCPAPWSRGHCEPFQNASFLLKWEHYFSLSMVNSSSPQTSDLTALRTKEPVLCSTVGFLWLYFY